MSLALKRLGIDLGEPILITFDAFGTLFAPREAIQRLYSVAAQRHIKQDLREDDVGKSFRKAFKAQSATHPNYGKGTSMTPSMWWENIIQQTFQPLFGSQDVPSALVQELWEQFSTAKGYTLYPDVAPFFSSLKDIRIGGESPRITTGVITNSDNRVFGILNSLGLGVKTVGSMPHCKNRTYTDLDFVTTSYDADSTKPASQIFAAAHEQALVGKDLSTFHQRLHIGDDLDADYRGASAAGWHALLIERSPQRGSHQMNRQAEPVHHISSLGELHSILSSA